MAHALCLESHPVAFFFFNDTATTEIYTLSLHDALPSYVRSTEWAAAKFHSYRIENVRLEPFTIPAGWQRGTASGAMLAPLSRPLNLASLGWSPSTPSGGVQGSVVVVADVEPEVLRSRENELRGKIIFLDTTKI